MSRKEFDSLPNSGPEWYAAEGLRFTCQRCGRCCSGPPGIVQCTTKEAKAMAQELKMDWQEFLYSVVCHYKGKFYVKEVKCKYGFDCILLERDENNAQAPTGCMVRNSRPIQCRTWPFWPEVVFSPKTWRLAAKRCPGIGVGELHNAEEIRRKVALTSDPTDVPPEEMTLTGRLQRHTNGN